MLELEKLNNKELRKMCVEHQLPNVPVTDTSRKVLIKRLEAAISGKPYATDKDVNRRTIHVSTPAEVASSNIVSEDSSASSMKTGNNRPTRHTMAVSERIVSTTTTVSDPESSDVSPDRVSKQVYDKMQTPVKENLYPKLPTKEPSPKPVMLSKTNVVTTSFIQEAKKNVNKTYADAEERGQTMTSQIQSKAVLINQKVPTTTIKPTFTSSTTSQSTKEFSQAMPSKFTTSYNQPRLVSRVTLNTYNSASGAQQDYNYNKSGPQVRKSYASPSSSSKYLVKPQYIDEYDDYDDDADRPDGYDDDDDEDEDEYEDDVIVVEDSPLGGDVKTPFLSKFARNLENLKAAPLADKYSPLSGAAVNLRQRESFGHRIGTPSAKVTSRRSLQATSPKPDPINDSFRQFIGALEEKYHFKWPLLVIVLFILGVFFYVFLVQSI
ncbi:otefin-like [Glossina fuscipes]|uniref:Otefin-like n=1 Tax=Glossina fuscipes TaxID=7396 RepID=A0A9C5Z0I7_9MUSC|nr:otefin-like [Glossina fuscipes]